MSKKTVKRMLAVVLSLSMMWGMCLNVSASTDASVTVGNATSCNGAIQETMKYIAKMVYADAHIMDLDSVEDINSLPAGMYLDDDDHYLLSEEIEAHNAFYHANEACQNPDADNSWGEDCECQEKYNAFVSVANEIKAAIKVSDGSKYVESDSSSDGSDSSETPNDSTVSGNDIPSTPCDPTVSGNDIPSTSCGSSAGSTASSEPEVKEVVKTPENNQNTFMEKASSDINKALEQINVAVAAGDTVKAQNLKAEGVTVDTGVWHSCNISVYEQIEKSDIPVTIIFRYDGLKWKVTIPAGAKVTELCDENGWCGFLNLAAHYGFEWL